MIAKLSFAALLTLFAAGNASAQNLRDVLLKHYELEAKLEEVMPDRSKLLTEEGREAVKEKAVPLLTEMVKNLEQIRSHPRGGYYNFSHIGLRTSLYLLEDAETIKLVDEWAKQDGQSQEAVAGKYIRICLDYANATDDAGRQKAIDAFVARAKIDHDEAKKHVKNVDDEINNHETAGCADFMLAVTPDEKTQDKILDILRGNLGSPSAVMVTLSYEAPRKLRNAMNKPVSFQYQSVDDKTIKASDSKGRVLLLTFFHTDRPRSVKELNRAARLAILNRNKGLDVVGVSCDSDRADLTLFLKANPNRYKFPILFDSFIANVSGGWHPLTVQYGVGKLPFTLLIDRKGVLRYANPTDLEAKLKELLDEQP